MMEEILFLFSKILNNLELMQTYNTEHCQLLYKYFGQWRALKYGIPK